MNQLEVKASQVQRPIGLVMVEFLSCYKVLQVLVVYPDSYQVLSSFQKVPLLFQHMDNSEYLLVMDLVVLFHQRQRFAVESHWVLFFFSR